MIQDGFFVLLKPTAFTSNDAIMYLRNRVSLTTDRTLKVGHLGTLDPGASGVLPIAVGSATKLFDYLRFSKKVYRAQAVFGKTTDTLDSYGKVISDLRWQSVPKGFEEYLRDNIERVFSSFIGKQEQMPPDYSSKSVNGVRAYDIIRKGEKPNLKPAQIEIYDIKLIDINENRVTFDLYCSGGTYVRSFVRDLGERLGYPAYMSFIIRKEADGFTLSDAKTLEEIIENPEKCFIDLKDYAKSLLSIELNDKQSVEMGIKNSFAYNGNGLYALYRNNRLFAIGYCDGKRIKKICGYSEDILPLESYDKNLNPQKIALCLGYFDSVHLGHQEILSTAGRLNAIPAVLTFYPSLKEFFGGGKDLFSFEKRVELFSKLGVHKILYLPTERSILDLEPKDFLDLLFRHINISYLIVGENYTFGKNALGNIKDIESYLIGKSSKLIIVKEKLLDNIPISTTLIKNLIVSGDVERASKMLGRTISVKGIVLQGRKDGRKIGFPTININVNNRYLLPKTGVYSSRIRIGKKVYKGVTNLGNHPTFNDYYLNAETYILDFEGDLYGKIVKIDLLHYLRPIVKFESVEELITQIKKDTEKVKNEQD